MHKTKIFILGSCVSRDAFALITPHNFSVVAYIARTSLGSAFQSECQLQPDYNLISSSFQRSMVKCDIKKELTSKLIETEFDYLLIDLIDERFNLGIIDNSTITLSNEFSLLNYSNSIKDTIETRSIDFIYKWQAGWEQLITLAEQHNFKEKIIINKVFWSEKFHNDKYISEQERKLIRRSNIFLQQLYLIAEKSIEKHQIIQYSKDLLVADEQHKWGASPFHYIKALYADTIRQLSSIQKQPSKTYLTTSHIAQLKLTNKAQWVTLHKPANHDIQIDITLLCPPEIEKNKALIFFGENNNLSIDNNLTKSNNPNIGFYKYLNTSPGIQSTRIYISSPEETIQFGIQTWNTATPIELLRCTAITKLPSARISLISVDVEALPGRATTDHVNRLIYGKFQDKEAGIRHLCKVFKDYGVRATFFIDYATTLIHGKDSIFNAAKFLINEGHDVQLHLHSEVVTRQLGLPTENQGSLSFSKLSKENTQRCIDFGISMYLENLGKMPHIFRPGGLLHSEHMLNELYQQGIYFTSTIFRRHFDSLWPQLSNNGLIDLGNGIIDIPVDIPLDPLVEWSIFKEKTREICNTRTLSGSCSLLLHSTSLLYRERSNYATFTHYHEPYEFQLRKYLEHLSEKSIFLNHSEFISHAIHDAQKINTQELYKHLNQTI